MALARKLLGSAIGFLEGGARTVARSRMARPAFKAVKRLRHGEAKIKALSSRAIMKYKTGSRLRSKGGLKTHFGGSYPAALKYSPSYVKGTKTMAHQNARLNKLGRLDDKLARRQLGAAAIATAGGAAALSGGAYAMHRRQQKKKKR